MELKSWCKEKLFQDLSEGDREYTHLSGGCNGKVVQVLKGLRSRVEMYF
jgi:hypothetical protein